MSQLFDSQVQRYKEKFHQTVGAISVKAIETSARGHGISMSQLKEGLLANSEDFRVFCYTFAKTLMPGRVSCTTYAAVVAVIAQKLGVEYKAYSGFCMPMSNPRYEEELSGFQKRQVSSGDEHPISATHVFLKIGDRYYEYFNGDTSNIDHIDYVEI